MQVITYFYAGMVIFSVPLTIAGFVILAFSKF